MTDVERQARELLAAEYSALGLDIPAGVWTDTFEFSPKLRAIAVSIRDSELWAAKMTLDDVREAMGLVPGQNVVNCARLAASRAAHLEQFREAVEMWPNSGDPETGEFKRRLHEAERLLALIDNAASGSNRL